MRLGSGTVGIVLSLLAASLVASCTPDRDLPVRDDAPVTTRSQRIEPEEKGRTATAIAPKVFPAIPAAAPEGAWVPDGYRVEAVVRDLTYPTSVEFDDAGAMYVAESGYCYGDLVAPARIWRIAPSGDMQLAVEHDLTGPVMDLLWHMGRLYISHRGKISYLDEDDRVVDIVTELPSFGDHHNNQLTAGPDGKLYVGQGTATNSGVVGLDNVYPYLWLTQHPDVHDLSPRRLELRDETFVTPDALTVMARQGDLVSTPEAVRRIVSPSEPLLVETGPFQPFGHEADVVEAHVKANGTILRCDPDGKNLEVYAWGLRNPFGLLWGPDGRLYAADNGYDERGSRPIANAPDCLWVIQQDRWYGFPDFAGGVPVTDERFRPTRGTAPEPLLKEPPSCEQPFLVRPPHATPTKLEFGRSPRFGAGRLFMPEFGSGGPVTQAGNTERAGFAVLTIDLETRNVEPFFHVRDDARGPEGYEHVVTTGPRRPIECRFSPDGEALYVVDFGALATYLAGAGPMVHPFPNTGVIWRIVPADAPEQSPPTDLSPLVGRGRAVKK